MKHLKFCMMHHFYSKNEEEKRISGMHPQKAMKELGITYQHATPQSMGDQWWFWNCENIPEVLPSFLDELKADPMECIGFGLNQETAEKIRDYGESHNEQR